MKELEDLNHLYVYTPTAIAQHKRVSFLPTSQCIKHNLPLCCNQLVTVIFDISTHGFKGLHAGNTDSKFIQKSRTQVVINLQSPNSPLFHAKQGWETHHSSVTYWPIYKSATLALWKSKDNHVNGFSMQFRQNRICGGPLKSTLNRTCRQIHVREIAHRNRHRNTLFGRDRFPIYEWPPIHKSSSNDENTPGKNGFVDGQTHVELCLHGIIHEVYSTHLQLAPMII